VALFLGPIQSRELKAQTKPNPPAPIIRVGIETGTSPLSHTNAQGQPSGFLVDLIQAIAKERNLQPVLDYRPWNELLSDFKAGKVDVLANMVFTPERDVYADFSIAHLTLPGVIYIRKDDNSIRTADDLRTKRIAAVPDGYSHDIAVKRGWGQVLIPSTSLVDSLRRLDAGEVDAVIGTKIFAATIIKEQKFANLQPAPFAVNDLRFRYHLAVLKGQDQLLYELNTGLIALRNNGAYDDLYEKWISPLEPRKLRWVDFRPYQFPSYLLLLALLSAFWLQRRLLSRMRLQAAALETSEERLTLVLEGSQDAFWDWNIAANKVTRSARWIVMLGQPELIGTGIEALDPLIHPDDLSHARHARELIQQQGHARAEYRIRDRNGHWLWVLDRGKVVARDASGRPSRITGAATDITARKRIEEALGRSQALLEQSQRAAEIGGWEYDVSTDQFYWTIQAFRIHDLDPNAGSPTLDHLFSLYKTTSQSVIRNAFQNALAEGTSFDVELEMQTTTQRPLWVRTIGRAEINTTQVVRVYGSFQDITQRKKADEERQKLQAKMQEAQKLESLGVLAGGIAHDFNNLLTVIMGNASIAKEDPRDAPAALHQIETATQRAADLCRQMLAYAGKGHTTMECIDLNSIVTDTIHLLRLSISKTAALEFALSPEPLAIEADTSQIRQVIMNLVINASDALGTENGNIVVSSSIKQLTAEILQGARLGQELPPGKYVCFEVKDNGCGMSADTVARIFDPFFTTKFSGRGLGLAAVLGIVRAHNGAFFVESSIGRGAIFRMLLPPTSKPLTSAPAKSSSRPKLPETTKSGTILVVDDEPGVRKLASNILEHQGYTVALASDGYEALALTLAHGGRLAAVLLDLTMPGLDGPSTLRELRQMKVDVPVLIMSGYSEVDVRGRFPDDPLLAFIPKPFTTDQLTQRLRELIVSAG